VRDAIAEFMNFNRPFAHRHPELLRLKVARMVETPFAFFRGTFHLYARDVLDHIFGAMPLLSGEGPELELVGDIHSENFGTCKAADSLIHYDINDFDETTHGRLDLDVCRLATSHFLAARERGDGLTDAVAVVLAGLATYTEAVRRLLKKGKAGDYDVSEVSPSGCPPVDDLVRQSAAVKRTEFIDKLTHKEQDRRLVVRTLRYFNLPEDERQQALRLLEDYRQRMPPPATKDFYEVEDVCGRVSGIGSMGRFRYVVLVAGKGKQDGRNVLLEFKEARPSAYDLSRQRQTDAAALAGRAERVIAVQKLSQAASNSHLGFARDGGLSFQVRELAPHDARIEVGALKAKTRLDGVAQVQMSILARTHARAAARAVGPANPLAELNDADLFCQRVLAFALAYADLVQRDWVRFVGHRSELEDCEHWADT
jgi:uncharacterized protein (DUF2252 family)